MQQRALTAWSPRPHHEARRGRGRNAAVPWAVVLALLLSSGLALAQASVDGQNSPLGSPAPQASTQRDINALYNLIFPISIVIGVLVEALLLYAIVRYRGKGGKVQATDEHERGHHKLEIAWTIPPAVILLIVGLLSAQTLGAIEEGPRRDFTVTVIASQFVWNFEYPDGKSGGTLDVEAGKVVDLNVTATDVIHSFSVPSLGVKIDAVPGRVNHYWLRADTPGKYQVQCMEYCGMSHAFMRTEVNALAPGSTPSGWRSPAAAGCAPNATKTRVEFLESGGSGSSPWSVDPETLSAEVGKDYCYDIVNPAGQSSVHNIEIIDGGGKKVATMAPNTVAAGKSADFPVTFEAPGAYTYYCAVPGHRSLGMEGTLTVA